MEISDINGLDIKNLRLLLAIETEGTVSAAAERRVMTQSTASYGLDKLRAAFGDPIFIRSGRGMAATQRGQEILQEVADVVARLDRLAAKRVFDPTTDKREFAITASAYEIHTLVGPLRRDLSVSAPKSRLMVANLELPNIIDRLAREWDLALLSYPEDTPLLKRVKLSSDHFVTYYDPEVTDAPVDLEAFAKVPHAVVTFGGTPRSLVDQELTRLGKKRRIDLAVQSFEALPPLMKGAPMIITLPKGFEHGLMRDFAHVSPPEELSGVLKPIHVYAVWHVLKDTDPALSWLRKRIRKVAASASR